MALQPVSILGSHSGLIKNVKPFLAPETAFSILENAIPFRERTIKRQGLHLLGRLQRDFEEINYFETGSSPWTFNINVVTGYVTNADNGNPGQVTTSYPHNLTTGDEIIITGIVGATGYNNTTFTITVLDSLNFTVGVDAAGFGAYVSGGFWISNRSLSGTEPNAQIKPGSVILVISGGETFTDQGNGLLTSGDMAQYGTIDYATGTLEITHSSGTSIDTVLTYSYYPSLPVMGIRSRQLPAINDEQTIFFDTRYAYQYSGGEFQEFIPGYVWDGSNSDFFFTANYPGYSGTSADGSRLFFVTNNSATSGSPMRYTSGLVPTAWTTFAPAVDGTNFIFEALILVPYYGRLLALNTREGATLGSSVNLFNRCRFSAIGNAIASDSWRSDIRGKGGFIDAPTNEAIVSAAFVKNTLIVFFEESTWQLRYVGNYGLPFLWERISSDFGSESLYSTIIFDDHALTVGSRALIGANGVNVERVDLQIPDDVFNFQNINEGPQRVHGVRDFEKEMVYWCYAQAGLGSTFPQSVLVYNYRNQTYGIFRDSITCFGPYQAQDSVTWDSNTITWDDADIYWDNNSDITLFPEPASGNQQGFVHLYNKTLPDDSSLAITSVTISGTNPLQSLSLVSPAHNLLDGDFVMLKNMTFIDETVIPPTTATTDLNNQIFLVEVIDEDTLSLLKWRGIDFPEDYTDEFYFLPISTATFVYGEIVHLPKMNIVTRDFNPYQQLGKQTFISKLDLLLGNFPGFISIQFFVDSALNQQTNLFTGSQEIESYSYLQGFISNVSLTDPCIITSPNHGLVSNNQITITNVVGTTEINDLPFTVTVIDTNSFSIDVDATGYTAYVSGGEWVKSSPNFFSTGADYLWHSFYATTYGQYIRIGFTYDNLLMNTMSTHSNDFELNAINAYLRPAGKIVF